MKLQHLTNSTDELCILCQMAESEPDREDGLCKECGSVSDSYGDATETSLDLDD
jgi:hypothetical protein